MRNPSQGTPPSAGAAGTTAEGTAGTAPEGASAAQADGAALPDDVRQLRARLDELQHERDHLLTIVDILQEISASLHFVDILQTIARKMGDVFTLDRCALFLTGDRDEVRLVASYEDPSIRNLVVDLTRYPELQRTFTTGETVFIPDAMTEPSLKSVRAHLEARNVRSIVVVPLQWQGATIGAIFLRTLRRGRPFSDADLKFCHVVASLTTKALRNVHQFEAILRQHQGASTQQRRIELVRIAMLSFLQKLLDRYMKDATPAIVGPESQLAKASDEELERLVAVAMQVFEEEATG
jgi:GAF domain-containing protein